jgi:hypothetical protein
MDKWFQALGYIGQVVAIISRVEAAEQAGQGSVDLPTFYVHTHKKTWAIPTGPATLTSPAPPPPKPPVPSPPA